MTNPGLAPQVGPDPDLLEQLVADCLAAFERRDASAVEAILSANPEHAGTIRSRVDRIRGLGLVGLGGEGESDPTRPEFIGAYKVLGLLGIGGMGEVWLAEQRTPVRRRVAIKVIKLGMDTREVILRFERERRALAVMDHPNIAKVLEASSTSEGRAYFVMEYAPGDPLARFCDDRQLTTEQRLELFLDVCSAVQHAHQKGIIHRDLKPSNVIVTVDGDEARPKVIDFGVAKATHGSVDAGTMFTQRGQVIGTREYMSPEQAGSSSYDVDTRTDIYALGVLLYELLTGTLPFEPRRIREASDSEWLQIVQEEVPRAPSTRLSSAEEIQQIADSRQTRPQALVRRLRGDLDWITLKALEKDRSRRYSTAQEFAADIRRHLANEPVLAGPPSRAYMLRKFVRRHRVGVITSVIVAVTVIAAAFVAMGSQRVMAESQRRYQLLAMVSRLERARVERPEIIPGWPEKIPRIQRWLGHYSELEVRLPHLRAAVAELEADSSVPGTRDRAELEADAFLLTTLKALEQRVATFVSEIGLLPRVRGRLDWAKKVRDRTILAYADEWAAVARGVAEDPRYGGLQLAPQMGLVPIGRDPKSGLYEFAHLRSGQIPVRDSRTGSLVCDADTAVVFVLLPAGEFRMGAQKNDRDEPNFDPKAQHDEGPVRERSVSAFFLAKHELNRRQWTRLKGGEDPSRYELGEHGALPTWPVDSVNWIQAERLLAEFGLRLPAEVEWEYGCRAGTSTPWWTGPDPLGMRGAANLVSKPMGRLPHTDAVWGEGGDRYDALAPVHSLRANAFGLHHMHGNVWEWCADLYTRYDHPEGTPPKDALRRVYRGGSFLIGPIGCRSSMRWPATVLKRDVTIGFRPARSVLP